MSTSQKLLNELKALGLAMLYFSVWFFFLIMVKALVLAEYDVHVRHFSMALIAALVLGKVVLVLEHVPLGARVERAPAWVDVLLRTVLYVFGVFIVMVLEKAVENSHGQGGFSSALLAVFTTFDLNHLLANTLCVSGALFTYNLLDVVRESMGPGGLLRLLATPRNLVGEMPHAESNPESVRSGGPGRRHSETHTRE